VKLTYLVLETPKAVATMVLVTVAFLCLGSSLLLVSSYLLCSLFSLGVLRLLPLFFVLRSWPPLFFLEETGERKSATLVSLGSPPAQEEGDDNKGMTFCRLNVSSLWLFSLFSFLFPLCFLVFLPPSCFLLPLLGSALSFSSSLSSLLRSRRRQWW
jgi:hypothetical protein